MPSRYFALIPAAGVGARMGTDVPKQYLALAGKPMILHAVEGFRAVQTIAHVFVVVSAQDGWIDSVLPPGMPDVTVLRCGGPTRRESVRNGLQAMQDRMGADDWVLVHDAARPGITPALIAKLTAEIGDDAVGGLLALPVADTVKREQHGCVTTVPREGLWLAQTPQMFRYAMLRRALETVVEVTDEAGAMEAAGWSPRLVEGHVCNSKVTRPADRELVEKFLMTTP